MGIELFNNNREVVTRLITDNHLISHNDNNAILVVNSAVPVIFFVSNILRAGFSTRIVQKGAGTVTVQALAGSTVANPYGIFSTNIANDMLQVYSPEPLKFLVQGIGTNSGCGAGAGGGPIKVTSAMFATATKYDDPTLIGQPLGIFWNETQKYLEDAEWDPTATGIEILVPGFNATANSYTFFISILTPPGV